jgi:hypothetical protein
VFGGFDPYGCGAGLRRFAEFLADRGALRTGLTVERATDLIWTICAQANYDALVLARSWTHQEYSDWLTNTLAASLLSSNSEPTESR